MSQASSLNDDPTQVILEFVQLPDQIIIIWRARILGRRISVFLPPYTSEQLVLVTRALDVIQHPRYPRVDVSFSVPEILVLEALCLWRTDRIVPNAGEVVGRLLYDSLGPEGKRAIKAVRENAIDTDRSIRYILRFPSDSVELAALPWELLWANELSDEGGDTLPILPARNPDDSCERYVDIERALSPALLPLSKPPHILAIVPRYGLLQDARDVEARARRDSWNRLHELCGMTYRELKLPSTHAQLTDHIREYGKPDIIHYFGHGGYVNGKGFLAFDVDGEEVPDQISAERLSGAFKGVRLVVLHACRSSMVMREGGLLTGLAPALSLAAGAVVAMQLSVSITAAIRFSTVFYEELLINRCSLQQAVARGRHALYSEGRENDSSWFVPTLYIRSLHEQPVYIMEPMPAASRNG